LNVINDVLDFSKIEAGEIAFETREFDLRDTTRTMAKSLAVRAREKGLELVCEIADDVPDRLAADPHRLAQVLTNLVGNALKFTHEGRVTIRVSLKEPLAAGALDVVLHFAVQDTGIGIPGDQQARIFEPFKQADGSTTRKYGGTGLGLSISTRLVEAMGGHLWLDSEEGRGSTFHFSVRVGIATAGHVAPGDLQRVPAATRAPAASGAPRRILVAEDNRVNQKLAVALLVRDGHVVTVVESGAAAVAAAAATSFDAILMDVQMPGMSGLDAAAAIRTHERGTGAHVPIVAMTAHAMDGDRQRYLAGGMDAHLPKPIGLDSIRKALAEALASGVLAS
jgi:two-component system CheB/CheR fusion protein